MRTFNGRVQLDFKIVVPESFTQALRDTPEEDITPFLRTMLDKHSTNDEAFTQAVLSNGVRLHLRHAFLGLLTGGLGGSVSPVTIEIIGVPEDFSTDVQPVYVEVHKKTKETEVAELKL
jgi:hypothetical protein